MAIAGFFDVSIDDGGEFRVPHHGSRLGTNDIENVGFIGAGKGLFECRPQLRHFGNPGAVAAITSRDLVIPHVAKTCVDGAADLAELSMVLVAPHAVVGNDRNELAEPGQHRAIVFRGIEPERAVAGLGPPGVVRCLFWPRPRLRQRQCQAPRPSPLNRAENDRRSGTLFRQAAP
jgi:hypothetical protein